MKSDNSENGRMASSAARYIFPLFGVLILTSIGWVGTLSSAHGKTREQLARTETKVENLEDAVKSLQSKLDDISASVQRANAKLDLIGGAMLTVAERPEDVW